MTTIGPLTGRDNSDPAGRPTQVDGNVTLYIESPETRREYPDMPRDHPYRLVDNPDVAGEAEG